MPATLNDMKRAERSVSRNSAPSTLVCFLKQELFQPGPEHCHNSPAFLCTRPIFKVDVGQKGSFYKLFSLQMWAIQLFYPGSLLNKSHVSDRPAYRRISLGPPGELLEELHPYGQSRWPHCVTRCHMSQTWQRASLHRAAHCQSRRGEARRGGKG